MQCFGCQTPFPRALQDAANGSFHGRKRAEGASESSRYECETCGEHFCIDCDVFCHEVVHNCPGCTSRVDLPGNGAEVAVAVAGGVGMNDGGG